MQMRTLVMSGLLAGTGVVLATAVPAILNPPPYHASPNAETSAPEPVASAGVEREGTPTRDASASGSPEVAAFAPVRDTAREVTVPAGTALRLRLEEGVGSDSARIEEAVTARLAGPVVVGGQTVLAADSPVRGHVTAARRSGKVKGRGYLAMRFTEVGAGGEHYNIRTRAWAREAPATKKRDAATIGVPAGVGAVVGGVVGGKKGAGIGAAIGGGAGTGVVLSTRGREVRLAPGATLVVRLAEPLTVRIRP